jgi:CRP/FNR family transcriptional regulator
MFSLDSTHILRHRKGDIISYDFDTDHSVYIIIEGIGLASYYLESGEAMTIFILGRGQTFGELYPFIVNRTPASFQALTDTMVCRISSSNLLQMVKKQNLELYNFVKAGGRNYHSFCRQLWIMNAQKVYDRIRRALVVLNNLNGKEEGSRPLIISHDDLALIINTDRPTVTRTLNRLKDEDLVELGYQRLRLKNSLADYELEQIFNSDPEKTSHYMLPKTLFG